MKFAILAALMILSTTAQARELKSATPAEAQVSISRIVQVQNLVNKGELQVNVAVQDLGGSTDVGPSQKIFFNVYRKSEMFNVEAAFNLGSIFSFESARRLSGGIYEIVVVAADSNYNPVRTKMVIDARKAITDVQQVACEDFDCAAATNFQGTISVK